MGLAGLCFRAKIVLWQIAAFSNKSRKLDEHMARPRQQCR
jgi:hypothetical protein